MLFVAETDRFDYVSITCRLRLVYVSFTCLTRIKQVKTGVEARIWDCQNGRFDDLARDLLFYKIEI